MIYPLPAKSLGDAQTRVLAQEALIRLLWKDPRVESLFASWFRESGLQQLSDEVRGVESPSERETLFRHALVCMDVSTSILRRLLAPLVATLPPIGWLSERLAREFAVQAINAFGANYTVPTVVRLPARQPRGRRAKGGAQRIQRDVEWFYRVHVQQPAESVRSLASEYIKLGRLRVKSDGRSTIQDGIKSACNLLGIDPPLPE